MVLELTNLDITTFPKAVSEAFGHYAGWTLEAG